MKYVKRWLLSVFMILFVGISAFIAPRTYFVRADSDSENVVYSDVLTDLRTDPAFKLKDYPLVADDYSVKLITIAEGNKNELFLYVYQPSHETIDLLCKQVSISIGYSVNGEDLSPILYDLELVSTFGVFDKYLVKNIPLQNEEVHYYNIVALYREKKKIVDSSIAGGTTDYKAYSVGEQWCTYMEDGAIKYEKATFKTVTITPTLNGNIYYKDGITWDDFFGIYTSCNSHFLAFNVDNVIVDGVACSIDVRHIYDADITYKYRKVGDFKNGLTGEIDNRTYPDGEDFKEKTITLTDTQSHTYQGKGLLAKEYSWKRIMTSDEFISNFENQGGVLNETSKDLIENSEYVFSFTETEHKIVESGDTWGSEWIYYTKISEVAVLRLHFMDTSGTVYNLGVVCDITTSDDIPDGSAGGLDDDGLLALILKICLMLLLSSLLSPIIGLIVSAFFFVLENALKILGIALKFLFKGIVFILKWALKIITYPLFLPFKLFRALFKRKK